MKSSNGFSISKSLQIIPRGIASITMYGLGFGVPIDVVNDPNELLTTRLSAIFDASLPKPCLGEETKQTVNESWFQSNIHHV